MTCLWILYQKGSLRVIIWNNIAFSFALIAYIIEKCIIF